MEAASKDEMASSNATAAAATSESCGDWCLGCTDALAEKRNQSMIDMNFTNPRKFLLANVCLDLNVLNRTLVLNHARDLCTGQYIGKSVPNIMLKHVITTAGMEHFVRLDLAINRAEWETHGCLLFTKICKRGLFDVATWFLKNIQIPADELRSFRNNRAFFNACSNGHLFLSQWLTDFLDITVADVRAEDNLLLYTVCRNGHLDVAKWLVETFNMGTDMNARPYDLDSRNYAVLTYACKNGHLDVVSWLIKTHGVLLYDIHTDTNHKLVDEAFCNACKYGHRDVAALICETVLERYIVAPMETLRSKIPKFMLAFTMACRRGSLGFVQWFIAMFRITKEDCRFKSFVALRYACLGGNLEIIQYLVERFEIWRLDLGRYSLDFVRDSMSKHTSIDATVWLITNFSLLKYIGGDIFIHACMVGNLPLIKWIINNHMDDISPVEVGIGLHASIRYRQHEIARLICDKNGTQSPI
jgi:hypothetical protein